MNKLTKLLSVFVIAGALGAGIAGVAGCKKGGGSTHTHSYTYTDNGDGTHNGECSCGKDPITNERHVYDNEEDTSCNLCSHIRDLNTVETATAITPKYTGAAAGPVAGTHQKTSRFLATDLKQGTLDADYDDGFISLPQGTVIRNKSSLDNKYVKHSVNNGKFTIKVPVEGKLSLYFASGSGTQGNAYYKLATPDNANPESVQVNAAQWALQEVVIDNAKPGTYTFEKAGGTIEVWEIKLEYSVTATPIQEIELVSAGTTDYMVTQKVDCRNVELIAKDEKGVSYPVDVANCEFDTSAYNPSASGEYDIGVTYHLADNLDSQTKEFSTTFKVKVYMVDSIVLGTVGLRSNKQVSLQQTFLPDDAFSVDNLSVIATCRLGSQTIQQTLKDEWLTVSSPSLATEGTKTVTVTVDPKYTVDNKSVTAEYEVAVKAKKDVTNNIVEVTVGQTGEFKTLTQAVQYLKLCNYEASVNKVIKLQAGTYTEKVLIDMDNVTLVGLGTNIDDTKLTYSLVEGDVDYLSGTLWALNCATLHVSGDNFKAYNLAIRNDFDYIANNKKYTGTQGPQGVALTLEGDGSVVYNCHLFGNQDTLYMKSGRAYYYKTQIDGNIDFIFGGEKGVAFFEECEIKAIDREGGVKDNPQNGYVTAPQHKEATKPDYGYIFYKCKLTDDGNVNPAAMSLGRPWGPSATVAYIECSFSAAYATTASTDTSNKINRWNNWDNSKGPMAANADYCEYGSTDASGAPIMQTAVTGGKVLTVEEAANYTKANIFGTANGKVGYTVAFDCDTEYSKLRILAGLDEGEIPEETTFRYDFTEVAKGSTETVQDHFAGKLEWTGKGNWNGNSIQVSNDTVIKLVKAGEVAITWYSGYGTNADVEITYDAEGKATITVLSSSRYIVDIVLNTEVVPPASVNHSVNVYVQTEGEPTLLSTITKPHGNVISEAAITSLITAQNYPGKMVDKIYASDKTTEYDYGAINADTNVYVVLKDASKTWQVGENVSLAFGGGVTPVVAGVEFSSGIVGNGSECKTNFGQTIKITAAAGTTAHINWHSNGGPTDNNASITYDTSTGQIVITIKAPEVGQEGNFNDGTLYIMSIDIVAATAA